MLRKTALLLCFFANIAFAYDPPSLTFNHHKDGDVIVDAEVPVGGTLRVNIVDTCRDLFTYPFQTISPPSGSLDLMSGFVDGGAPPVLTFEGYLHEKGVDCVIDDNQVVTIDIPHRDRNETYLIPIRKKGAAPVRAVKLKVKRTELEEKAAAISSGSESPDEKRDAIVALYDRSIEGPLEMQDRTYVISTGWQKRFKPHDMNYIIYQSTERDDSAIEVQYSGKFLLYNCEFVDENRFLGCRKNADTKVNVSFTYTGKFDFYVGSRESGPVINRTSNPAGHVTVDYDLTNGMPKWFDFSYQHRSNGQSVDSKDRVTDATSPFFGQYISAVEYNRGNHEYFDRLSTSADYFELVHGWQFSNTGKLEVGGKIYLPTQESTITWGRYAGTGTNFKDFDLLRVKASDTFFVRCQHLPTTTIGLEYRLGENGFSGHSIDFFLLFPFLSETTGWNIPFMVKAHLGPMERLSDYSASTTSVGAGFALTY